MEDFEKRQTYIADIESNNRYLNEELAKYKQLAEYWQPRLSHSVNVQDNQACVVLHAAGKAITATMTFQSLQEYDVTNLTTNAVDVLVESLFAEVLRPAVQKQIEALQTKVGTIANAGKW